MAAKSPKRRRTKNTASENRRHHYDSGGRRPLTKHELVPVSAVVPESMAEAIDKKCEKFINPRTLKPYGRTAFVRICLAYYMNTVHRLREDVLIEYLEENRDHTKPGRTRLSDEQTKRISLLIPIEFVTKINDRIESFESRIIGTTTVIRYFIAQGLKKLSHLDLYKHMTKSEMAYMFEKKLTIEKLLEKYERKKPKRKK